MSQGSRRVVAIPIPDCKRIASSSGDPSVYSPVQRLMIGVRKSLIPHFLVVQHNRQGNSFQVGQQFFYEVDELLEQLDNLSLERQPNARLGNPARAAKVTQPALD
jgi:hypothetical protein